MGLQKPYRKRLERLRPQMLQQKAFNSEDKIRRFEKFLSDMTSEKQLSVILSLERNFTPPDILYALPKRDDKRYPFPPIRGQVRKFNPRAVVQQAHKRIDIDDMMSPHSKWEIPETPCPTEYQSNNPKRKYNFPDCTCLLDLGLDAIEWFHLFWNTAFEVDGVIYPKMADWEKLGRVPPKSDLDFHTEYVTYKKLNKRLMQCNGNWRQFVQKYKHCAETTLDVLDVMPQKKERYC